MPAAPGSLSKGRSPADAERLFPCSGPRGPPRARPRSGPVALVARAGSRIDGSWFVPLTMSRRDLGEIIQLADERGRPLGTGPDQQHATADPEQVDRVFGREAHATDDLHGSGRGPGNEPASRGADAAADGQRQRRFRPIPPPTVGAHRSSGPRRRGSQAGPGSRGTPARPGDSAAANRPRPSRTRCEPAP